MEPQAAVILVFAQAQVQMEGKVPIPQNLPVKASAQIVLPNRISGTDGGGLHQTCGLQAHLPLGTPVKGANAQAQA
jgi:hypothetical protein